MRHFHFITLDAANTDYLLSGGELDERVDSQSIKSNHFVCRQPMMGRASLVCLRSCARQETALHEEQHPHESVCLLHPSSTVHPD